MRTKAATATIFFHALVAWMWLTDLSLPIGYVAAAALVGSCALILSLIYFRLSLAPGTRCVAFFGVGLFSFLLTFMLIREVVLLLAYVCLSEQAFVVASEVSAGMMAPIAAAGSIVSTIKARRCVHVVCVEVPLDDLPDALCGFTIVQISDVHVGDTVKGAFVRRIVAKANALEADVVAITGDLVDGELAQIGVDVAPIAALRARHGVYLITGNHEYYSGVHLWMAEFRRLGLKVLVNEHVALDHDGASVAVTGITDSDSELFEPEHACDLAKVAERTPQTAAVKILLAHRPCASKDAARLGFHLQLSGHTHGGQFWPWTTYLRWSRRLVAGLYRVDQLWLYVSCGAGYWGPPMRLGAPPEISKITLVRSSGTSSYVGGASPAISQRRVDRPIVQFV